MKIVSVLKTRIQKLKCSVRQKPVMYILLVWFGLSWIWIFNTDMLDLAGSNREGLILATFVYIINVTISTLVMWKIYKVLNSVYEHLVKSKSSNWLLLLGLPVLALADFLCCWLTAIVWLGPQGQVGNIFPIGSMALPVTATPLRFASRLVGFYGLAAFVWGFLFLLSKKQTRRLCLWPVAILAILSLAGWGMYRTTNGVQLKATVVSESLTKRVPQVDSKKTDLVVFPEYGLDDITNKNFSARLSPSRGKDDAAYFVGSSQIFSQYYTGHINSMIFGNSSQGITQRQNKHRLIPAGEDLPYVIRTLLRATGQKSTLDYFSYSKGVLKGSKQLQPFKINDQVVVGAAVCSSIISPEDYRHFSKSGATILTNSASLGVFNNSPVFSWQQQNLARFMATANSRYFIQSANEASAYVLDSSGNKIVQISGKQTANVTTQTNSNKTFYTYAGEWLVTLGAALSLGLTLYYVYKRRKA